MFGIRWTPAFNSNPRINFFYPLLLRGRAPDTLRDLSPQLDHHWNSSEALAALSVFLRGMGLYVST